MVAHRRPGRLCSLVGRRSGAPLDGQNANHTSLKSANVVLSRSVQNGVIKKLIKL